MISNIGAKTIAICASLVLLAACQPNADSTTEKAAAVQETKPAIEAITAPAASKSSAISDSRGAVGAGVAGFGDSEEEVRSAYAQPMRSSTPAEGSSCLYLYPEVGGEQDADAKQSIAFMFEENKFVRIDVYDDRQAAPGNIKIGDSVDSVKAKFAGRFEQAKHKYIENGFMLTVAPEDKTAAHLVFEIDANGRVISWRYGLPPQIFYVEGCS